MTDFYVGGPRYKDYLELNRLTRDINGQIRDTGKRIGYEISEQTRKILASNSALMRRFGEGFDEVNHTLRWGFRRVVDALSDVSASLEALRADFNYGVGLILGQLWIQNKLLFGILAELDAIHKILESPILTQAREFFRIGCERLSRGLLDKALESFLEAEKKNDTDFVTQSLIGLLYLYGRDDDDDVINLLEAEKHLRLAVRYGMAEITVLPESKRDEFKKLLAEVCLHTSIACYVQVNEPEIKENPAVVSRQIEEARSFARKACEFNPGLSEAHYHYAKYSALLNDDKGAVLSLREAIDKDWNYCLKADIDKDFDPIRPEVIKLFDELRVDAGKKAREKLNEVEKLLTDWVYIGEEAKSVEEKIKQFLSEAKRLINQDTYFDYLDALSLLTDAERKFHSAKELFLLKTLEGHSGFVYSVVFSPDGSLLASGSLDKTIKIWGVKDGKLLRTLEGHSREVTSVVFSPDGSLLASGSWDATIKIWGVEDGKLLKTLEGHSDWVTSVVFSPDGSLLASGSWDKTIKIWGRRAKGILRREEYEKLEEKRRQEEERRRQEEERKREELRRREKDAEIRKQYEEEELKRQKEAQEFAKAESSESVTFGEFIGSLIIIAGIGAVAGGLIGILIGILSRQNIFKAMKIPTLIGAGLLAIIFIILAISRQTQKEKR